MRLIQWPRAALRRALAIGASGAVVAAGLVTMTALPATGAETCTVSFDTTVSEAGFTHPGVGLTAENLETAREQIASGTEPWASYFEDMKKSPAAAIDAASANESKTQPGTPDSTAFDSQGFNSRFIGDALKAYTQSILYAVTGEQEYRTNAMEIIRIWEQMDPDDYAVFPDSHIHTGVPLNRMTAAAEILRYGSCEGDELAWTDADTEAFTTNLIEPVTETFLHDQNHFMNQHTYPLLGAMAGYIFTENRARYDEAVEWFTVNSTAENQGFNGSVARLFRLVDTDDKTGEKLADPRVQHVEMGRDQAHGGGDITNASILSRMMMAQGTKVDPVAGTVSTAPDAVGPFEFGDDRILAAADYFWSFMLGHDPEWTPVGYSMDPDGTVRDTYDHISNAYRGRYNTASVWDLYYYYAYTRGEDMTEIAPNLEAAFEQRLPLEYYYGGALTRAWDSPDAGGDFWLFLPESAAGSSVPAHMTSPTVLEIEDRWTPISGSTAATTDFVTLEATEDGSKIAFRNGSTKNKAFALRVRTDDPARLELTFGMRKSIELPDTNGEWRQVTVTLDASESLQDLVYIAATGDGTSVDVDSLDIAPAASGPELGAIPARVIGLVGSEASVSLPASEGSALRMEPMPEGASLDGTTLSWTPGAAGTHDALVTADDGSAIASRTVAFIAAEDRTAAIAAAADPHDDDAFYTRATRDAFDAARLAAEGADPDAFPRALADLTAAADALRLVSPTVADGSLDYPELLASSTAGNNTGLLVDGDNQTGTVYSQAVDRAHVFDFGPFATVSASSFMLQSNIFEDRLANSAVFGSNDGTTWDRLTPGVTEMTQDEQTLEVAPELRDKRYHQLKVQLLEPLPDVLYGTKQGLVEFTEFHIFGERHEATGDIDAVSISAPGSLKGRVVAGDEVRLDLHANAAISDLAVTIAGIPAEIADGGDGSWTATAVLPPDVAVGAPLGFTVDHVTHDGRTADGVSSTTDGSTLYVSTTEGLVDDVLASLPVTGEGGVVSESITRDAASLFDGDPTTHSDTRLVGPQASLVWDLGQGGALRVSGADVLVRQDQYGTSRLNGLRFEGSNDLSAWTPLTTSVVATPDWQRLDGVDGGSYRYVRLTNRNIINVAEVRLFGEHSAPVSDIVSLHVSSSNAYENYAVAGDTVTLDITVDEAPQSITATIDGAPADVVETDTPGLLRASAAVDDVTRGEKVAFQVTHTTAAGHEGVTLTDSTDRSAVVMGTDDGLVADPLANADALTLAGDPDASTTSRPGALFDGDLATSTDARVVDGSADIVLDFGENGRLSLDRVELALRQDGYGLDRLDGMQLQASDDLRTWEPLVAEVAKTHDWQFLDSVDHEAHRYLRITNRKIMGIAELRLFGEIVELPTDPVWDASAVYDDGDRVSYGGRAYVAQWWTKNETPGSTATGSWMEEGALVAGTDVREWTASWVYDDGDTVSYEGRLFRAKWWTRNQEPGDPNGPWEG